MPTLGHSRTQRVRQEVKDRIPNGKTDHHADDKGDHRMDQPRAQLGQMLDQRGGAVVNIV
jgi:hypothetical protein